MVSICLLVHYSGVFWHEKSYANIHFTIQHSWKLISATPILDCGKIQAKIQKLNIWLVYAYWYTKVGYFGTGNRIQPSILDYKLRES